MASKNGTAVDKMFNRLRRGCKFRDICINNPKENPAVYMICTYNDRTKPGYTMTKRVVGCVASRCPLLRDDCQLL